MWDLTANACSCELVPEVGTAVRSLTVALDGSMVVAANNHGTCYVWRMLRGTSLTTHFEPLHKLRAHSVRLMRGRALRSCCGSSGAAVALCACRCLQSTDVYSCLYARFGRSSAQRRKWGTRSDWDARRGTVVLVLL